MLENRDYPFNVETQLIASQRLFAPLRLIAILFILLFFNLNFSHAQDTVKVMHYNLLNYGNTTGYCNTSNNNIDDKDPWLREILNYVKPDILTVNEIGANTNIHQRLLDSTLNVNGIGHYAKSVFTNMAGSYILNMLYYDTTKFVLHSQDVVQPVTVRDINIYKLYYRSADLAISHDTIFIICLAAHLKAGNNSGDAATRAVMTLNMMNYLSTNYSEGNFLFCGDYNTYTSSATAYQNLVNYSNVNYRFHDPINRPGGWNNNSSFADIHTQSTHSSSNGCASGGGMDDRFDQILISEKIINGSEKVEYIYGSYTAVGQDELHFNQSINGTPTNTSVPADVLNALYNMSDHLPVTLDLKITSSTSSIEDKSSNDIQIDFINPVNDVMDIRITSSPNDSVILEIYSRLGTQLEQRSISLGDAECTIDLTAYPVGLYFLVIRDSGGSFYSEKFIKI
ncbi:MAG: T9SS type A sorting domain-containing protein [Bacteroidales bacterium]|nr:T9SS type A sorting domain-containing protein [Bacteroidales bacterium]